MSSFIDSGLGLVLSVWFVLALVLNAKKFYICEANGLGVVWCSYNERTNHSTCLQTLVNKCAELCLANSRNNTVTTIKYIEYMSVKFYCDVITRSRLRIINTSIDTFFSKLRAF